MGKSAKLKLIRRMAKEMPTLNIKTRDGIAPANHAKKMKQLYDKYGSKGILGYAYAVQLEGDKIKAAKAVKI